MNELGNIPADKDYKPSGIVNDLTEGQVKAVKLPDGTYITEKLAKSMTKAEEAALKAYPPLSVASVCLDGTVPVDLNTGARKRFIEGYEAAEKDLALTWEDMQKIYEIICGIDVELESLPYRLGYQEYWEAVLTRFKQFKEAKQ